MIRHPYQALPDSAFWRRTVAAGQPLPTIPARFQVSQQDRIATAGSCFAQHIGPMLRAGGFDWHIAETAHPMISADLARDYGYGQYSARFGNIYTVRQLHQLWQRAYGLFAPQEGVWAQDGRWLDPFRPQIQPDGFASAAELEADRAQHLAAVRRMFETLDVFVFTLGQTQVWRARADGAVFPLCPGVGGGVFSDDRYEFHDFSAPEIEADLLRFIADLRVRNPAARVILTVSPVPLVATAVPGEAVLLSASRSKARLIVAAEQVEKQLPDVAYFPSYELVMSGAFEAESYFDQADHRSVKPAFVARVLAAFAGSFAGIELNPQRPPVQSATPPDGATARLEALMQLHCDELLLDQS
jgi:hypothetical protein